MIAVIADDFTGAAEIGGIAIRQGFKASITIALEENLDDVEILIVATNTREEKPQQARKTINALTRQLMALHPKFIFKKIDSVLRGNVGEELMEQMDVCGKKRTLIVPANPALQRTIKEGIYYYNDVPLNRSNFMATAAAEKMSAHVIDLIGMPTSAHTVVVSTNEKLPLTGFAIGNTATEDDLLLWATKVDEETVAAGGSSFFNALLKQEKKEQALAAAHPPALGKLKLFVCGSAFEKSRNLVKLAKLDGRAVCYMPERLLSVGADRHELMQAWMEEIVGGLSRAETVIIAVDGLDVSTSEDLPSEIANAMAAVVAQVMKDIAVAELAIEGGSTAAAIIEKLNYRQFYPVQEFATGVIRMRVAENEGVFLTLKPGSYHWPALLWKNEHEMD